MMELFKIKLKEAVNAFADVDKSYDDFIEPAVFVYNAVANNQNILKDCENPYLLGLFYSYIEGAFRDSSLGRICVENAFYCYMKCIEESESVLIRKSAAMRMFLLMYDNGYETAGIAHSSLEGTWEYDWNVESKILLEKVKQHCYCIFSGDNNDVSLDTRSMDRLAGYVRMSGFGGKEINYDATNYSWIMMRFYLQDELNYLNNPDRFEEISEDML